MNELKYVIVIPKGFSKMGARAIIFNGIITHSSVVKELPEGWIINSAGFMYFETRDISSLVCHGSSESLNVKSEELFDRIIIRQTLERQPINM